MLLLTAYSSLHDYWSPCLHTITTWKSVEEMHAVYLISIMMAVLEIVK